MGLAWATSSLTTELWPPGNHQPFSIYTVQVILSHTWQALSIYAVRLIKDFVWNQKTLRDFEHSVDIFAVMRQRRKKWKAASCQDADLAVCVLTTELCPLDNYMYRLWLSVTAQWSPSPHNINCAIFSRISQCSYSTLYWVCVCHVCDCHVCDCSLQYHLCNMYKDCEVR